MSRTVILYDMPSYLPSRWPPATFAWPVKDPADVVKVSADFCRIIGAATIVMAACQVVTTGSLVLGTPVVAGSVVSMLASGGTDQEVASALITVTLNDGEVVRRCVILPVLQQGQPSDMQPTAATPLLLEGGGFVTIEGSNVPLVLE